MTTCSLDGTTDVPVAWLGSSCVMPCCRDCPRSKSCRAFCQTRRKTAKKTSGRMHSSRFSTIASFPRPLLPAIDQRPPRFCTIQETRARKIFQTVGFGLSPWCAPPRQDKELWCTDRICSPFSAALDDHHSQDSHEQRPLPHASTDGTQPRILTSPLARVFGPGSMRMAWSMGFS